MDRSKIQIYYKYHNMICIYAYLSTGHEF